MLAVNGFAKQKKYSCTLAKNTFICDIFVPDQMSHSLDF